MFSFLPPFLSSFFSGPVAFAHPWLLVALAGLPVLWFLLRVFPPVPRLVRLPGVWLLDGLVPDRQTSSTTPWWLLLLRAVIAALVIFALAHPVINPARALHLRGALRIIVENDWAAAQTWNAQIGAAQRLLDRAAQDGTPLYILTTAPEPGQNGITEQGPLPPAQARNVLNGLRPHPWPSSYGAAAKAVRAMAAPGTIDTVWVGDGLESADGANDLADALLRQGNLTYMEPEPARRPVLLLPRAQTAKILSAAVQAAPGSPDGLPVGVEALSPDGRVIDRKHVLLHPGNGATEVSFDLPDALRGKISQIRLSGRRGAGAVVLLDTRTGQHMVGVVGAHEGGKAAPLTEAGFYITRALKPYAETKQETLEYFLAHKGFSVLVLPDIGALPAESLESLEEWIKAGGLLLRTAGPNMSKGENFLTPTPLRHGARTMNGAMAWEKPQKIAPFPKTSPFYGLDIPQDVFVRRQILAEPVPDLKKKTWAALTDGTPLVTAAPLGKGLVVLLHTTATPLWSNLALSGLYVKMLQRVVALAGQPNTETTANGTLRPRMVLDGFGALAEPGPAARPVDARMFDTAMPDSLHPPGLYGRTGLSRVMNIGGRIKTLTPMEDLPAGVARTGFIHGHETDLMPVLLLGALALFMLDWVIMIGLQGLVRLNFSRLRLGILMLVFAGGFSHPALAQDNTDPARAGAIYLAYVLSGQPAVDTMAQRGLENLAKILTDRTSVEPAGVVALNPARDDLSFYPLLYWPLSGTETPLPQGETEKVQFYLDHGGTILFDTRGNGDGNAGLALQMVTRGLDIPPLVKAPADHVLTKSFYLLRDFPGRYDNAPLWVEQQSTSGRDGVSSVLVGGNDWASAWAGVSPPAGSRQQEMALRFGVNLVMYALTGNYKADQVHVPYILQRLGR